MRIHQVPARNARSLHKKPWSFCWGILQSYLIAFPPVVLTRRVLQKVKCWQKGELNTFGWIIGPHNHTKGIPLSQLDQPYHLKPSAPISDQWCGAQQYNQGRLWGWRRAPMQVCQSYQCCWRFSVPCKVWVQAPQWCPWCKKRSLHMHLGTHQRCCQAQEGDHCIWKGWSSSGKGVGPSAWSSCSGGEVYDKFGGGSYST